MTIHEIEAEVLKLPEQDRRDLIDRLKASLDDPARPRRQGSIWDMDITPVGARNGEAASNEELEITLTTPKPGCSIWDMGRNPGHGGPADGSLNHDRYVYESDG
jgi:hypothetical protein